MNKKLLILAVFILSINWLNSSEMAVVENLRIDNQYVINFTAMNTRFEGFVSSSVISNISDGTELEILETNTLETDQMGRYRVSSKFKNPLTQEEFELTSKWIGGDVFENIITSSNLLQWNTYTVYISDNPSRGRGMPVTESKLISWKIEITTENGSSFILDYPIQPGRYYDRGGSPSSRDPGYIFDSHGGSALASANMLRGTTIEIIAEWPGSEEMKKNYKSYFLIKNTQSNTVYNAIGDTHFIEGFGTH